MPALLELADAVERWHELQRPRDIRLEAARPELERRWISLRSVGIYVPRGLISTPRMCAVPARTAGVERIVIVTPPRARVGSPRRRELGLGEVWAVGGPPAIAAPAYEPHRFRASTRSGGPGAYVNEAKPRRADVAIDIPRDRPRSSCSPERMPSRASSSSSWRRRPSTGRSPGAGVVDVNGDLDTAPDPRRGAGTGASRPPRRRGRSGGSADSECRSGLRRPVVGGTPATTRPEGTTCRRRGLGARGGWIGLETFLKPITTQRVTADGPARCGRSSRHWRERRACSACYEAVRR